MHFWGHYIMNLLENMDHELWESKNVIYCYTNKINGKRYVGQTVRKLKSRHIQHISAVNHRTSRYDNFSPIHRAIRKYGIENFKLEILHVADKYSIDMLERHYIYTLNTFVKNKNGYNISSGGSNGNPFAGKTEEEMKIFRNKCKINMIGKYIGKDNPNYGNKKLKGKNNPNYGKKMSEEQKRKISESRKGKYAGENSPWYGRKHSEESRRKMSETKKEKYAGGKHPHCIPIVGVGIDNVLSYKYISEAKDDGFNQGAISKCCKYHHDPEAFLKKYKHPHKSYKGYKWYYKEDYDKLEEDVNIIQQRLEKEIESKVSLKNIVAVSIKDEEILFFENASQAIKDGFDPTHIHKCCRGEAKTHKYYKWYYKEDYDNMNEEDINIIRQRLEEEFKVKNRFKNIVAVSTKSEEMLFFENSRQAIKDGFRSGDIHKCCRGELKTHKGYKWYYKEDYDKMITETD